MTDDLVVYPRQGRTHYRVLTQGARGGGIVQTHPNLPPTALARRLRDLREGWGLTQPQLAAKLPTGAGRVSDYELGVHIPTLARLIRYARAFDTTVSQLLNGVM